MYTRVWMMMMIMMIVVYRLYLPAQTPSDTHTDKKIVAHLGRIRLLLPALYFR